MKSLPLRLQLLLALVALLSFSLSVYLEENHLEYLDRHPIMVNLLSGVVGFSAASLVISIGFDWYATKETSKKRSSAYELLVGRTIYMLSRLDTQAWEKLDTDLATRAARVLGFRDAEEAGDSAHAAQIERGVLPRGRQRDIATCRRIIGFGEALHEALSIGADQEISRARRAVRKSMEEFERADGPIWDVVVATTTYVVALLERPECDHIFAMPRQ
ncbi:hypothetical protein [Nonomuraea sp. NPDC003804]|uniref:hypothetical protein n=1 Tax=Nonomuraea sp. NPDC003804 TaxID=3154547 RepID=UPI0033AE88D5